MRVLVTRPLPDATRTAGRLRALGHAPLVGPVLIVRPTGEPPPVGAFDAVLVTSANAVPALAGLDGAIRAQPLFALGPRTAALAREAGFTDASDGGADALALAASVRRSLPPPSALLHVAGRDRKPEPQNTLAGAGYRVTVWDAYAAVAASRLAPTVEEALAAGAVDAVLHYSRRSATVLRRLSEEAGLLARLEAAAQICLSGDVAEALAGASRLVVSAAPTEEAMLDALGRLGPPA